MLNSTIRPISKTVNVNTLDQRACLNRLVNGLYNYLSENQLSDIDESELDSLLSEKETSNIQKLLSEYKQACGLT